MVRLTKTLFVALGLASEVMGHGAIWYSEADGIRLAGYFSRTRGHPDANDHSLGNNWLTPKQLKDFGYISPEQYNTPDVICHIEATNAPGYLTVKAGDVVTLKWTPWPFSHHGPMIDYLANCNGDCTTVDKTSLKFHKIAESGLLDPDHKLLDPKFKQTSGYWASDRFREAGDTWSVQIPATIAPGSYILRQETIALHSSMKGIVNGTQNYPQCFNLNITGSGTDALAGGTPGTELYSGLEPGLHELDIFADNGALRNYSIPGPPLHVFGGAAPAPVISHAGANTTTPPSSLPTRAPSASARYRNSTSSANTTATFAGASSVYAPTKIPSSSGAPDGLPSASSTPGGGPGATVTVTTTLAACPTGTGAGETGWVKVRKTDLDDFLLHFNTATEKFMLIMEGLGSA